ncbi:MAG: hypothetical protein WC222_11080 [Parachlamydiales bacterium]|jgi:hypothetical protein
MRLVTVPLSKIAKARSGDKGGHVNIGLIANNKAIYDYLKTYLKSDKVAAHFAAVNPQKVIRYDLDNLEAFNFMLYNVLEGGGSLSLRIDSQGKTFGQALLLLNVEVPDILVGE